MPRLLAIGLGYSVSPLCDVLRTEGWSIAGTTRDPVKADGLARGDVTPVLWTAGEPLAADAVTGADLVIISIPPDAEGCPAARALAEGPNPPRIIYLSSSGVYGDHDGAWIDEETPCVPTSARGENRLRAEAQWQALGERAGVPVHLCRLSGIYGPGRNALETLRGQTKGAKAGLGQRVIKPGQVFNRIHRDDIVAGLRALIDAPDAPMTLNFADDEPSPPQDVITFAAELLGVAPPPEVPLAEAQLSPMGREFYRDNKRLRNNRLKSLPGFELSFPSYRDGLRAIARSLPPAPPGG